MCHSYFEKGHDFSSCQIPLWSLNSICVPAVHISSGFRSSHVDHSCVQVQMTSFRVSNSSIPLGARERLFNHRNHEQSPIAGLEWNSLQDIYSFFFMYFSISTEILELVTVWHLDFIIAIINSTFAYADSLGGLNNPWTPKSSFLFPALRSGLDYFHIGNFDIHFSLELWTKCIGLHSEDLWVWHKVHTFVKHMDHASVRSCPVSFHVQHWKSILLACCHYSANHVWSGPLGWRFEVPVPIVVYWVRPLVSSLQMLSSSCG